MDEPFSAVDPVVRERLQSEFLRLQETVRKTIVFVTHDIEEAVRLGDRIAVMSEGGKVEQFATPAELLGKPASPFVADFVGSDRALKRLAVTGIDVDDLERPPVVHVADGLADARAVLDAHRRALGRGARRPGDAARLAVRRTGRRARARCARRARRMDAWVPVDSTLKNAFATMLRMEAGWVAVLDGDRFLGVLTPESLHAALRRSVDGTVPETAGVRPGLRPVGRARAAAGLESSGGTRQADSSSRAPATQGRREQPTPTPAVTASAGRRRQPADLGQT